MSASAAPGSSSSTQDGRTAERPGTVKNPLTANRPRAVVENPEYAAFARRILKACARRIAAGDIESLALMAELADTIGSSIRDAVTGLREHGYSWAEIGSRLGVTRQAAQQRWETGHDPESAAPGPAWQPCAGRMAAVPAVLAVPHPCQNGRGTAVTSGYSGRARMPPDLASGRWGSGPRRTPKQ
jgi:hypothetical protein